MGQKKIKREKKRQQFEAAIARSPSPPKRINQALYDQAAAMMTPEQIEEYKKMGEEMYENIEFDTSKITNNPDDPLAESAAYISEGIKSGLHPSFLDEDELKVMVETYGDEWYKKFGYDSVEL